MKLRPFPETHRALLACSESGQWEPMPPGNPITAGDGSQVQPIRYLKDLIGNGDYEHPELGWKLGVDGKRRGVWEKAFGQMQANGVKVPIYADHKPGARNTLGYLTDVFQGGDMNAIARHPELANLPAGKLPLDTSKMYGIHEFTDQASADLANRVGQVSVLIDKDMTDGAGNSYGEAIRHVAVTPEPIVPGQQDFVRLAASRENNSDNEVVVYLLASDGHGKRTERRNMDELLMLVRKLVGADKAEGVTEANALSLLESHVVALGKLSVEHDKDGTPLCPACSEPMACGTKDCKFCRTKGAARTTEIDSDVLDQLAEAGEERILGLSRGEKPRLTPAVAKALVDVLVGKPATRNAYALSRTVSGTPESLLKQVVKALEGNDVVKLGEHTKGQQVALSRQTPGESDTAADPKLTESMVAMAGGK